MDELLFLSHRIPYPPNKGDKLRSFNLLKQLGRRHRVHVGTFIDDEDDWRHADAVRAMAGECRFVRLSPRRAKLRSLPALLGARPLSLPYYRDGGLQGWVDDLLAARPVRQVVVFSGAMAQYVEGPRYAHLRRIVDFVDVDSDKWQQYAASQAWPMNWIYRREARTLLAYERRVAAEMDAAVFVSAREAAMFRELAPEAAARVIDVHNGVDTDYFDPARPYPSPYPAVEQAVVFTGAMDYRANADAVAWFAREVWPLLRTRHAQAQFYIVGARPAEAVRRLGQLPGITVTGAVHDIRPYLAHARAAVAPLRIARGVQNKVLEAMAMARPVVATPQALEGIECRIGTDVIEAEDAADFAERISELLMLGPGEIGAAARQRVVAGYAWESNLRRFESLLADAEPVAGLPVALQRGGPPSPSGRGNEGEGGLDEVSNPLTPAPLPGGEGKKGVYSRADAEKRGRSDGMEAASFDSAARSKPPSPSGRGNEGEGSLNVSNPLTPAPLPGGEGKKGVYGRDDAEKKGRSDDAERKGRSDGMEAARFDSAASSRPPSPSGRGNEGEGSLDEASSPLTPSPLPGGEGKKGVYYRADAGKKGRSDEIEAATLDIVVKGTGDG